MSGNRQILRNDLSSMDLLDELALGAVTDGRGLTLGDVAGHRRDHHRGIVFAVNLAAGLGRRGVLRASDSMSPIGAEVQDKTGIEDFQAAHVLPCDFDVNGRQGLHECFVSPIIRGNVQSEVFGWTNMVHRLVNYADRRCEANGWIHAFRAAVRGAVAAGAASAALLDALFAAYAAAVNKSRTRLESGLTAEERSFMRHGLLVAPNGLPAQNRVPDFRVTKRLADPRQRAFNKHAVLQVYDEYLRGPAGIAPSEFVTLRRRAEDWIDLEMRWRASHG